MKGKWKKCKFIDVANVIGGGTPSKKIPEYWNGDIDWLTVNDFNHGRKYVHSASEKITKLGLEKSSTKILKKGQIIISARGTVGVIAVLKKDMAFNQSNYGINAKGNITFNDYLYYLLKYKINELKQASYGAVFDTITKSTFENLEIEIPESIDKQRAIASVLSSLDDKIDLLHRQNKTLEQTAETIFRKWFIEDAKEDWEVIHFGEIVHPKRGKNITKSKTIEGPYPVVAGGIEPSCYHSEYNTLEPVVTISASGASAGYVRLYHTKVWASDCSYLDYSVTPYLYFCYVFLKINQHILFDKQTGSAQPHIYPTQIMELELCNYPKELIEKFEKWCKILFDKIKQNQQQIRTLEKLRDTLLPKLISGEVRVRC